VDDDEIDKLLRDAGLELPPVEADGEDSDTIPLWDADEFGGEDGEGHYPGWKRYRPDEDEE
jgi:hypothetical protein